MRRSLDDELENLVVPSGNKIHAIVQTSFEVGVTLAVTARYILKPFITRMFQMVEC